MKWTVLILAVVGLGVCGEGASAKSPVAVEESGLKQLLTVRRVYVDRLTGGETAAQMRDILMSSLQGTKLFVLTENQERADAILRGAAEDLVFNEVHSLSDGMNARTNAGAGRQFRRRAGALRRRRASAKTKASTPAERRHEAIAAVRLVNKDGDVIWATTQESLGAKFRGASADVAEKITVEAEGRLRAGAEAAAS